MDALNELRDFYKKLRRYQNRQKRRSREDFSEAQDRSLDAFRLELQRYHGRLSDTISKYGGGAVLPSLGIEYEVFTLALGSLNMHPNHFTALDGAISLVNKAVAKLESEGASWETTNNKPGKVPQKPHKTNTELPKVFIAHGGESPALDKLTNFLIALGIEPLVVEEQPSEGRSISENVDYYARQSDFAIILATKGDIDGKTGGFIPRGNVSMEIGKLQELLKDRIVYLLQAETKFPSDISEKVRERFTPQSMDKAFIKVARELKKCGIIKAVKPQE